MDIECELYFIQPGRYCFGDFVDNTNSNLPCEDCITCIVNGLNNATAISNMFERDCNLYSSDCGFNLESLGNDRWQITIGITDEKHLSNLIYLKDSVNSNNIINREKVIEARAHVTF